MNVREAVLEISRREAEARGAVATATASAEQASQREAEARGAVAKATALAELAAQREAEAVRAAALLGTQKDDAIRMERETREAAQRELAETEELRAQVEIAGLSMLAHAQQRWPWHWRIALRVHCG